MANIYPPQVRAIDPYCSYDSNIVNILSRGVTRGTNSISRPGDIEVFIDPANPRSGVIIKPGICSKDDVIINITADFSVNMQDQDFYINLSPGWGEFGYYYIVVKYIYVKSKPAPQASIKIIKPSERASFSHSSYVFLKAVLVGAGSFGPEIHSVLDGDPENPDNRRMFFYSYLSPEEVLPSFSIGRDEGRLIMVDSTLYFGSKTGWESPENSVKIPTNGFTLGSLVYLNSSGTIANAIGNDRLKYSNGIVKVVSSTEGKVLLSGIAKNVLVQSGVTLTVGDQLYLSSINAGRVTNLAPSTTDGQYVGRCVEITGTTCTMWYQPCLADTGRIDTLVNYTIPALQTSVTNIQNGSDGTVHRITIYNKYPDYSIGILSYYLINTSSLNKRMYNVQCYMSGNGTQILPQDVLIDNPASLRVVLYNQTGAPPLDIIILG